MLIKSVRKGTRIRIFDSPDGDTNDDYTDIVVKKDIENMDIRVDSFERTFETEFLKVEYVRNNDLDGKVSRFEVHYPSGV